MGIVSFSELKLFREIFTPPFLLGAAERNTKVALMCAHVPVPLSALWADCHPHFLKCFPCTPEGEERDSWALFGTNWSFLIPIPISPLGPSPPGQEVPPGLQGSAVLGAVPWLHPTCRAAFRAWALQTFGCKVVQSGLALLLLWEAAGF